MAELGSAGQKPWLALTFVETLQVSTETLIAVIEESGFKERYSRSHELQAILKDFKSKALSTKGSLKLLERHISRRSFSTQGDVHMEQWPGQFAQEHETFEKQKHQFSNLQSDFHRFQLCVERPHDAFTALTNCTSDFSVPMARLKTCRGLSDASTQVARDDRCQHMADEVASLKLNVTIMSVSL